MPRKECTSREKFIRLGAAVGLGSAAVLLVAACGGGASGGVAKAGKGLVIAKIGATSAGDARRSTPKY